MGGRGRLSWEPLLLGEGVGSMEGGLGGKGVPFLLGEGVGERSVGG